jgi:NAD(P)-dependent dehydrogenase (short-subunit alcohol dehydrogenase family)
MANEKSALIIGNSDGIGLALTRRLLDLGWSVTGLSRSASPINQPAYNHAVVDVTSNDYLDILSEQTADPPELSAYCAGIGEPLDLDNLQIERKVFEVNLMGAVRTLELVLPAMHRRGGGHVIVLSSIADVLLFDEAPSYSASKAGLSSYLEGLALALKGTGLAITNVRFGFVDTKMAKGDKKPMMISVDRAVDYLMKCIEARPIRFTRPRLMGLLALVLGQLNRIRL